MTPATNRPVDPRLWDAETSRRQTRPLARWVRLGSLVLVICLWLATLLSIWSVRDAAIRQTTTAASNLSAAFCDQIGGTLNTISATMDLAAREIRADPGGFRLDLWAALLHSVARPTFQAGLVDGNGRLIKFSGSPDALGTDLSDREHVRVQLATPHPALFVSAPVIGRMSGRLSIEISKRVEAADGHLLGVLIFSLAPDDLTTLHRAVDLGPRGVMALTGEDGRLRARFDAGPEAGTGPISAIWPVSLPDGMAASVVRSAAVENIPRQYSMRRLPSYPLIVAVGLDLDAEMIAARTHTMLVIGIGAAASLLLFGMSHMLVREIRRRDSREIELAGQREALEAARSELTARRDQLAAVNQELTVSSRRAEAASEAKSQFLAQMSHELRTPLHAVIGFSDLIGHLAAQLPGGTDIAAHADDILKSGRHLLALINSILDLSKIESGKATLQESTMSLTEAIQDSLITIRGQAAQAGVRLDPALPRVLPDLFADATKIRQILINLLSNAVKFTPRDGTVAITARPASDGGYVIVVSDTGIGMTPAEAVVAMEPFGQVENSLARSFDGTGLGLPLARRLTELHGGRLQLHSVKGVGTTVEVVMPADRVLARAQGAMADARERA